MEGQIVITADHILLGSGIFGVCSLIATLFWRLIVRSVRVEKEALERAQKDSAQAMGREIERIFVSISDHEKQLSQIRNVLYAYGIESMRSTDIK